jgi:hypothetical protein
MHTKEGQRIYWKVMSFKINEPKAIIQLDAKLAKHYKAINSISTHIIPRLSSTDPQNECGELSLSINNAKEQILHTTIGFDTKLQDNYYHGHQCNAPLHINNRISGYYRDNGQLRTENGEFIPYTLKLILECKL